MTPSLTMNWNQPYCPRFCGFEMLGPLRQLKPDLRCLIQDFRDHAWINFGLPDSTEELEELARTFGFSRYKFRKLWDRAQNFFQKLDGKLFYADDEQKRTEAREKIDKSREYGKIGAEIKRQRQSAIEFPGGKFSTSPPSAPMEYTDSREREEYSNTAAAEKSRDVGALATGVAAADLKISCPNTFRLIASIFADVTPEFVSRLLAAAQKVSPDVDDSDLSRAVQGTYKRGKQISAGLFLETVPAWLQNHQQKPPQPETYTDSMGRVRSRYAGG